MTIQFDSKNDQKMNILVLYSLICLFRSVISVTGGDKISDISKYCYQAAVYCRNEYGESELSCGGVIVGPKRIVTSTACLERHEFERNCDEKWVRVGTDLLQYGGHDRAVYYTERYPKEPEYAGGRIVDIDITILFLTEPLSIEEKNICQIEMATRDIHTENGMVEITGYGIPDNAKNKDEFSHYLRRITVPIIGFHSCNKTLWEKRRTILPHSYLCYGGENGKYTADIDFGGKFC